MTDAPPIREREHQVYLLRNSSGKRYIGITADVHLRVRQHNEGISRWTRGRGPWRVEWVSRPMALGEARRIENLMKRQNGGRGLESLLREYGSSGS